MRMLSSISRFKGALHFSEVVSYYAHAVGLEIVLLWTLWLRAISCNVSSQRSWRMIATRCCRVSFIVLHNLVHLPAIVTPTPPKQRFERRRVNVVLALRGAAPATLPGTLPPRRRSARFGAAGTRGRSPRRGHVAAQYLVDTGLPATPLGEAFRTSGSGRIVWFTFRRGFPGRPRPRRRASAAKRRRLRRPSRARAERS